MKRTILSLILAAAIALSLQVNRAAIVAATEAYPAISANPTRPTPVNLQPAPDAAMAGEQIKWQVIAGGGGKGTSTNYAVSGTVGQTAAGSGASSVYKINQGFWQNFTATGCCVGRRGNVNMSGIVDLSDLSSLISYLTGGGYVLPCFDAANVNVFGIVDLADLSALISYLTGGGYVLANCP